MFRLNKPEFKSKVICMKCNHCRDIDLCRDPFSNLSSSSETNDKSRPIGWYCFNCSEFYDTKQIEYSLIESLHTKIMAYVTQDIKCQKCNEVRAGYLQKYCECTGTYENLLNNDDISHLIKALINFTKYIFYPKFKTKTKS